MADTYSPDNPFASAPAPGYSPDNPFAAPIAVTPTPEPDMPGWQKALGIAGEGAVRGLTSVAGMPVWMFNTVEQAMMAPRRAMAEALGWERAKAEMQPMQIPVGDSEWLQGVARETTIPGTNTRLLGNPEFKPETMGEKVLSAAAEGAASAVALPLGTAGAVARGVAGAGAGAGNELAKEAYAGSLPDRVIRQASPTAGQIVSDVVVPIGGAIAGAAVGGGLANAAARGANYISGKTGLAGDYLAEGVKPRLVGDLSGGDTSRRLQSALRDMPGSSGRMRDAAQATIDDLAGAVERRAGQMGTATDAFSAGQALQAGANRFTSDFKAASAARYQNLDRYIPANSPVQLTHTGRAITDLAQTMADAPETAKALTSPLFRTLQESLARDLKATGTVRYETLKRFRSEIGAKLANPAFYTDTNTAEIKALYSALSRDMLEAANARGPAAVNAFREANGFFSQGIKQVEDIAARVADKGINPEQAYKIVMQGAQNGPSTLAAFRKIYNDDEWGMLASATLRRMGAAPSGVQNAPGDVFSPATFLTNWNKLHPQSRALLANGDVGTLQAWNRLANIAGSMKETQALANSSRTAGTAAFMSVLGSLGAAGGSMMAGAPGAAMGAMGAVAGGLASANVAARLMTNPAFARWLATPVGDAGVPAAIRRLSAVAASAPEIRSEIRLFLDHALAAPDGAPPSISGSLPAPQ